MNTLNDNKFNFQEYNVKLKDVHQEQPNGELEPLEEPTVAIPAPQNKSEKSEAQNI